VFIPGASTRGLKGRGKSVVGATAGIGALEVAIADGFTASALGHKDFPPHLSDYHKGTLDAVGPRRPPRSLSSVREVFRGMSG
jgi:hypothetical protein